MSCQGSHTLRSFPREAGSPSRFEPLRVSPLLALGPRFRRGRAGEKELAHAAVLQAHRRRRSAAQGRHQHRPGRAGAGDARAQAGLQGPAVHAREAARRRQRGPRLRAQQAAVPQSRHPRHRQQFRRRLVARGGGVGHARQQHPRDRGAELCRHLSRELPAERPAAGHAGAGRCGGIREARDRSERRGAVHGRSRDPDHQRPRRAGHQVRHPGLRPHAAAGRARRYRHDAQAHRRHQGVREDASRRAAVAADRHRQPS